MKRGLYVSLLLCGLVIVARASDVLGASKLKTESAEKIRSLADEHPALTDVFLPDEKQRHAVPMAVIPAHVKSNAVYWVEKVVRSRWLPRDMEGKLVALKDVKLWEKKDSRGVVFSERKGDFLTLEYEVEGHKFYIQESGVSVSIRVDLAQGEAPASDPASFIRKCLTDFLNLPAGVTQGISVERVQPLYKATIATERTGPSQWWDSLKVFTDGEFFFVTVAEVEPGSDNPRAQPGLPDRF